MAQGLILTHSLRAMAHGQVPHSKGQHPLSRSLRARGDLWGLRPRPRRLGAGGWFSFCGVEGSLAGGGGGKQGALSHISRVRLQMLCFFWGEGDACYDTPQILSVMQWAVRPFNVSRRTTLKDDLDYFQVMFVIDSKCTATECRGEVLFGVPVSRGSSVIDLNTAPKLVCLVNNNASI